tara:strand:- start:329 stop:469 length:141 start_codon:yes stop_codon:yes gene_type:complete
MFNKNSIVAYTSRNNGRNNMNAKGVFEKRYDYLVTYIPDTKKVKDR